MQRRRAARKADGLILWSDVTFDADSRNHRCLQLVSQVSPELCACAIRMAVNSAPICAKVLGVVRAGSCLVAVCRRPRDEDEDSEEAFYFLVFEKKDNWASAKNDRRLVIRNKGECYPEGAVLMFVRLVRRDVSSLDFHLDGFGRLSRPIESCEENEEVALHFSEFWSSDLGPEKLWKCAESEDAGGLIGTKVSIGATFNEKRCRTLCTSLFGSDPLGESGRRVTKDHIGWVHHMLKKAAEEQPSSQPESSQSTSHSPSPRPAGSAVLEQPLTREGMEG